MARLAIEPLVLLSIVDESHPLDPRHQLVAPQSIRTHALNILLSRVRRGEMSERSALGLHEEMTGIKMRLFGDRVSRRTAWQLALAHGWDSMDDAEYIAVASLQADALVSANALLATRAQGIVPIAPMSELFSS